MLWLHWGCKSAPPAISSSPGEDTRPSRRPRGHLDTEASSSSAPAFAQLREIVVPENRHTLPILTADLTNEIDHLALHRKYLFSTSKAGLEHFAVAVAGQRLPLLGVRLPRPAPIRSSHPVAERKRSPTWKTPKKATDLSQEGRILSPRPFSHTAPAIPILVLG